MSVTLKSQTEKKNILIYIETLSNQDDSKCVYNFK